MVSLVVRSKIPPQIHRELGEHTEKQKHFRHRKTEVASHAPKAIQLAIAHGLLTESLRVYQLLLDLRLVSNDARFPLGKLTVVCWRNRIVGAWPPSGVHRRTTKAVEDIRLNHHDLWRPGIRALCLQLLCFRSLDTSI